MDFWRSALQAAEKAAEAAKDLGKKGLEVVEATAEEASKKLNLNLHDTVGTGDGKVAPPSEAELAAYGVTPDFAEFVRTLNYSTFRDFPPEHLLPSDSPAGGGEGSSAAAGSAGVPAYRLNPWQVRHATLVVQALKEVNELRFVLCPKYMTDEHFWHVYFTLARKYLPEVAFSWVPGQPLPYSDQAASSSGGVSLGLSDTFSFSELGDQLKRLGSKIQTATSAGAHHGLGVLGAAASSSSSAAAQPAGREAPGAGAGVAAAGAAGGASAAAAGDAGAGAGSAPVSGLLEEDPDLEAYLQVAINTSTGGSQGDEEGSAGFDAVGDDDLDLDSYINELSAEVDAAEVAAEGEAEGEGEGAAAGQEQAEGAAAKQD